MPGQRYINPNYTQLDTQVDSRKDRLMDTLLLITGFVFASSIRYVSDAYLYLFIVFLSICILIKSAMLFEILPESLHDFVSRSLYILVSFLFPLVMCSTYFLKHSISNTYPPILLFISLLAGSLLILFMWDSNKDYTSNVDNIAELSNTLSKPFTWASTAFFLLVLIYVILNLLLIIGILETIVTAILFLIILIKLWSNKSTKSKLNFDSKFERILNNERIRNMVIAHYYELLILIAIILTFATAFGWYVVLFNIFPNMTDGSNTEFLIQNASFSVNNQTYKIENASLLFSLY